MPGIWDVSQTEIEKLGGGDGTRLSRFVDRVIGAEMRRYKIPKSELETDQRTVSDGGADTALRVPIADSPSGFFAVPTVWQYKSSPPSAAKLREEIKKPYVKVLIEKGYAYRLAIPKMMTPEARDGLLEILKGVLKKEHPTGFQEPKIVGADHLAELVSQTLGLVKEYFRPELLDALALSEWEARTTQKAPRFVDITKRAWLKSAIQRHSDLADAVTNVVLSVVGESGVGKTRIAYQSLRDCGMEDAVLYVDDSNAAIRIARYLATTSDGNAILVFDEATADGKATLRDILTPCKDRVRVIAIETSDGRDAGFASTLKRMEESEVSDVLAANYAHIPEYRLRAYSSLSEGFPQLALYLCEHDSEIAKGEVQNALHSIADVIRQLEPEEQEILQLLSLVLDVGYRSEMSHELDILCLVTSMQRSDVEACALRISDGAGFVARAGRFLHATPGIVAQTALAIAWHRWAVHDVSAFLSQVHAHFPDRLLDAFLKRIGQYGAAEVQAVVAGFFRNVLTSARPSQLGDAQFVDRLLRIVEVDLTTHVPLLRNLLDQTSSEDLEGIRGEYVGRWGSRRSLVWFAERAAAFPDLFLHAEAILWRLATHENEPSIGNNATAQWQQLFRVYLSGTAIPYQERLPVLQRRLDSADVSQRTFVLRALTAAFETWVTRTSPPEPMLGGRIPPAEWLPDNAEATNCVLAALVVAGREMSSLDTVRSKQARLALFDNLWSLISAGYLDSIISIFDSAHLEDDDLMRVVAVGQDYLQRSENASKLRADRYDAKLARWLDTLITKDDRGDLLRALAAPASMDQAAFRRWQSGVQPIVARLLVAGRLWDELPQISRTSAHQMFAIGRVVGYSDDSAEHLGRLIQNAISSPATIPLTAGYLQGLKEKHPATNESVARAIRTTVASNPALGFELAVELDGFIDVKPLIFELVDARRVHLRAVERLAYSSVAIDNGYLVSLVTSLLRDGDTVGYDAALGLIDRTVRDDPAILNDTLVRDAAWRAVSGPTFPNDGYRWQSILQRLGAAEPARAARVAMIAMGKTNYHANQYGEKVAMTLLAARPSVVTAEFLALLGDDSALGTQVHSYRQFVATIPAAVTEDLIRDMSVDTARRLARHLPAPVLGADGQPSIPPLTEAVLDRFGEDDETIANFAAGARHLLLQWGPISAHNESDRQLAVKLLAHRSLGIRRWAEWEEQRAIQERDRWLEREEEQKLR